MNDAGHLGLAYKTRVPRPARGVIARPRLDALREFVRARALTLVTAPPGYGKTSVGLAWAQALASEGMSVAWLQLARDDDEPERFLGLLAAALRGLTMTADPPALALPWSRGELSIPVEQRVEWLIEQLDAVTGEVVLFVDDAHELRDAGALQILATLLRFAGEQFHLVLLGRAAVPLELGALRAHDAVFELQGESLCFDLAETDQLLRKARSRAPAPEEAAQLRDHTGGWIAALRAALLTQRLQDAAAAPAVGALHAAPSRRTPLKAVQSLFAELIEQLPRDTLRFVEAVSVTRRTCAGLAEALSGDADAARRLDRLESDQLFMAAFDDDGWTEFHPLFREFVQRQMALREPLHQRTLHRAAAAWLAGRAMWAPAIEHALAGDDTAQALAWIEQSAMTLVGAGDLLTLLGWERQLRAHLVQSPPRLRLAFAWGLSLSMACDRALALLDGVEAEFAPSPDFDALRDECLALRAVIVCTTGDYELAAELAGRLDGPARPARPTPWVDNAVRNVIAAAYLHTGRWQHLHGAPALVGDAAARPRPGDPMSVDYRLTIQGLAEYRQGHLDDAAELLEQAIALRTERRAHGGLGDILAALPAPTLALVRYEQDRVAEAARLNSAHFEVNRRMAPIEGLYGAYLVAARVARLEGHAIRARHLLDEGESIGAARGWRRAVVALRLERLRHCLLDGRLAEAAACVDGLVALALPGPGRPALECLDFGHVAAIATAWRELAAGSPQRAIEQLRAQHAQAVASGRLLDELMLGTGLALAHLGAGAGDESLVVLAAVCRRAMAVGALRSMADQPVPLQPLLRHWAAHRDRIGTDAALDAHVERLRAAARASDAGPGVASLIETLSPRELHILKLMADGRSNKEIARGLGIAPETVKTHVSKIFGKLGASNRAQAAAMMANV